MTLSFDHKHGTAEFGWGMKLLSLACIGFGLVCLYGGYASEPSACNPQDDAWIAYLLGGIFLVFGIWNTIGSFFTKISWDGQSIHYPDFWGRPVQADIADIESLRHIPFLDIVSVKIENAPTLYFSPYIKNDEGLGEAINSALKLKSPELFVVPAFRECVEKSDQCGCMVCLSIFDPGQIQFWRSETGGPESEGDLAACPICRKDFGVVCDFGDVSITRNILEKLNEEAMEELNPVAAAERRTLYTEVRRSLSP